MSDLKDTFQAFNEDRKQRHATMKQKNIRIILESDIVCVIKDEVVLFRPQGADGIDFYPSTGRWKNIRTGKIYKGGAKRFLASTFKHCPNPQSNKGGPRKSRLFL